jgi:ribose transport system ATP-binding protein
MFKGVDSLFTEPRLEPDASGATTSPLALKLEGASKRYGMTQAVNGMSLAVARAQVMGVIGPNGAGKSTLMRIIAGEADADSGRLMLGGQEIDLRKYSRRAAERHGVRTVHQELSLCTNLRVYENFMLEYGAGTGPRWRAAMKDQAARALAECFPGSGITPMSEIGRLSLAQQQMVEIARAVSSPKLHVLILDEPTSALPADRVDQLREVLARLRERGVASILITHRLTEIVELTENVVVMRNGEEAWRGATTDVTRDELVAIMSGAPAGASAADAVTAGRNMTSVDRSRAAAGPLLEVSHLSDGPLQDVNIQVNAGEIVGVYGLEGSGQRELLRAVFSRGRRRSGSSVRASGRLAFVSGDRRREGLFPLWPIAGNLTLSALGRLGRAGVVSRARENSLISRWLTTLAVRTAGRGDPITALSGGNQQKVIIARALATEADLVLLDDPTRGVDPGTKTEVFQLLREASAAGRGALLHSTEEHELLSCDRVYVMSAGAVVAELSSAELTAEGLVTAAFRGQRGGTGDEAAAGDTGEGSVPGGPPAAGGAHGKSLTTRAVRSVRDQRWVLPVIAAAVMLGVLGGRNSDVLTSSGLNLIVGTALPLVIASLGQMFIVAAGDIDLGIGAFLGLVNAICVTLLARHPGIGMVCLAGGVVAYLLLGALVQIRQLPAIVATLGASFIWLGLGLTVLPTVGGEAPSWLLSAYSLNVPGIPEPILITIVIGALSYWVMMRSRYGVLLRGFGNNPAALVAAGRSSLAVRSLAFAIAGTLSVLAGLCLTAVTTSGDPSAAQSYTLLSITAVIIGGSEFSGGIVAPVGVVAGAVTLSFIGVLLSLFSVDPNYTSAVVGLLLAVVLAGRGLFRRAVSG